MGKDKIIQKRIHRVGVRSSLLLKHWGTLIFWELEKEESTEEVKQEP